MTPREGPLMTTQEVRDLFAVSRTMVYKLARRHRWDRVSVGRATRWKRAQVMRAVDAMSRQMR